MTKNEVKDWWRLHREGDRQGRRSSHRRRERHGGWGDEPRTGKKIRNQVAPRCGRPWRQGFRHNRTRARAIRRPDRPGRPTGANVGVHGEDVAPLLRRPKVDKPKRTRPEGAQGETSQRLDAARQGPAGVGANDDRQGDGRGGRGQGYWKSPAQDAPRHGLQRHHPRDSS